MPASSDPLFLAFGATVRELRKERGLSQESLAERAQMHRSYVGDVEIGRRNVSLFNMARLAEALDIPLSRLVGLAEDRAKK